MVKTQPFLSVVIPAFNEQSYIRDSLFKLANYAGEKKWPTELVVVDDGSTDGTAEEVKRFTSKPLVDVILVQCPINSGKGAAVKRGMAVARGDLWAYMDADLSYDLEALELSSRLLNAGNADIVVGDRTHVDSRSVRPYPWIRKLSGQMFSVLIQIFLFREVFDTQCGFKCCMAEFGKEFFPLLTIPGFGFDVELLYLAARQHKRICRIPVVLNHCRDSRVRVVRDAAKMFLNLFEIRRNYRNGRYGFHTRA
jgi:dolichyl-phosphate beta-glucosyltransferase